jgi:predicted ester cyclase
VVYGSMREFRGHAEIKAGFEMDRGAVADYTETVEETIAAGDIVARRLTERGPHDGALLGIEPTGNAFEIQTMTFLRLEGGKVVETARQSQHFVVL